jgi:hypothetical protein
MGEAPAFAVAGSAQPITLLIGESKNKKLKCRTIGNCDSISTAY